MLRALNDARLRQAKPGFRPLRLSDGDGLYLLVQPSGSKGWRFDYTLHGGHSPAGASSLSPTRRHLVNLNAAAMAVADKPETRATPTRPGAAVHQAPVYCVQRGPGAD